MDNFSAVRFSHGAVVALLIIALFALFMAGPVQAGESDLDPTFGNNGTVITDIVAGNDDGWAVAIDANGKILAAGSGHTGANDDFALVRYNSNGALDTTFGSGGKVTTAISSTNSYGHAMVIDVAGQILGAGKSYNGADDDFALVRYSDSGALDTAFGSGGIVTTDFGTNNDDGHALAIDANGKILVAGDTDGPSNRDIALARYNIDGSLNISFGSGGMVTADFGASNEFGRAMAIDASGKILVAGTTDIGLNNDFALARFSSNGALDGSFGSGGKVTTDFGLSNDYGYAMTIDANGKILVAGDSGDGANKDFALARYNSNGALDSSFGSGGKVTTDFGSTIDHGYAVAIDGNGKILVAGTSDFGSIRNFALARYESSGALDSGFGVGGKVTTAVGISYDDGHALAIDGDGKILVAGTSYNGANDDFALVRYGTAPEIVVVGNGIPIANGHTTPTTVDHTDFGHAGEAGESVRRVFGVENRGNASLILGANAVTLNGPQSGHFSVTDQVAPTVSPNTSTPFEITFDPSAKGTFTATVSIANNDSEQSPFTFTVQGAGVEQPMPDPRLAVAKSADVVEAIVGETRIGYSYRVSNTGDVALAVEAVDDVLGAVPLYLVPEGALLPSTVPLLPDRTAMGTRSYTPQVSDLPGPLTNTVVVTGTDSSLPMPVNATVRASVDLLLRAKAETMYHGVVITFKFDAQTNTSAAQTFDLIVVSGPAPQGLLLKGAEQIVPYTDYRSMIGLTNQLVTAGCPVGVACNQVTRTVFDENGNYHVETIQEVQLPPDLFLPAVLQ